MTLDIDRYRFYALKHLSRDQLQTLSENKVPLTGPHGLRRWIAQRDVEAFARLYFPEEFVLDPPPIHQRFCTEIQELRRRSLAQERGIKLARAIPRGHAKSTFWSRIAPLHGLLFSWSHLTVLLGNTQAAAERLLKNIKDAIEGNEAIREDFGDVRGDIWTGNQIQSAAGDSIFAFGVGNGAIRGVNNPRRPRLIIADDLDDDQLVRSAVELEAAKTWFDKAVLQLGDNINFTTSFVVLGTVIKKTSLLCHILDKPDFDRLVDRGVQRFADAHELWQQWRQWFLGLAREDKAPKTPDEDEFYQEHKTALLRGAECLWERTDGYYGMMVYRASNGDAAFNSEIQNNPTETGGRLGLVPSEPMPTGRYLQRMAALDSTVKGGKANDLAAWVEVLLDRAQKKVYVVGCDARQRPYNETISDVVARLQAERFDGFWVETNSAGSIVADLLEQRIEALRLAYVVNRVHNSRKKEDRIQGLTEWVARGQLVFCEGCGLDELIREWEDWPDTPFDDALDALATILEQLDAAGLIALKIADHTNGSA